MPVGADFQIEVVERHFLGDGQFFPFRPFDHHLVADRLQFHQGLEAVVRVIEMPFPVILLLHIDGHVENGTEFFDIPRLFFFQMQVSPSLQPFAVDLGHDIFHALARFQIMSALDEGFDEHFQAEAGAIGDQMHVNGRIGLDEGDVAGFSGGTVGGDGGMDGHEGGDVADGGQHLFTGRFRHRYAVLAGYLGNAPMVVVDADDFDPGRRFLLKVDIVGGDRMGKADMQIIAFFLDQQFRFAGHEFHRDEGRIGEIKIGVADHRQKRLIHIQSITDRMGLRIDGSFNGYADLAILGSEIIQFIGLIKPGERNRPPFAPFVFRRQLLLPRGDGYRFFFEGHHPDETRGLLRTIRILSRGINQRLQTALPRFFRGKDGEQGDNPGLFPQFVCCRQELGIVVVDGRQDIAEEEGEETITAAPGFLIEGGDFRFDIGFDRAVQPVLADAGKDHRQDIVPGPFRQDNFSPLQALVDMGGDHFGQEVVGIVFPRSAKERLDDADAVGNFVIFFSLGHMQTGENVKKSGWAKKCDIFVVAVPAQKTQILGIGGQGFFAVAA
ncbi:MAG: hypothetical protein ACD_75C02418G0006 [uncultured bacterium]|nr:MAG: hypothetical protein ACD_75C02418G0006 [uncultured bacterium]